MAEYLVLIYEDEAGWAEAGPDTWERVITEHRAFGERNGAVLRGGHGLHPTETATFVRTDNAGGFTVTDGPFAETKEALTGFYVIEAADLDAAVAIAKQVPAPFGGVEVRPVRVFDR
ncbi:MAG: hypothetical protein DLM60_02105 [Pseudonocardiales bacterium]|nr:MAG: hypothetical protein DLM60_02105 [Pseudonocardiales bacterium]